MAVNIRLDLFPKLSALLFATATAAMGFGGVERCELVRQEVLEAIHQVENPRDLRRPGRHGELGAYQFRPETWRMHTRAPFMSALERRESDAVAIRHYDWLERSLARRGVAPTTYNIALAWNAGLAAAARGRAPAAAHDYATRVNNLVQAALTERLAVAR